MRYGVLAVLLLALASCKTWGERIKECEAKGGMLVKTHSSKQNNNQYVCINRDIIVE